MAFSESLILHPFPFLILALFVVAEAGNLGFERLSIADLLPSTCCTPPKAEGRGHIKILHRNGPCSGTPSLTEEALDAALSKDSLRVASIQKMVGAGRGANGSISLDSDIFVPAKRGLNIGASNYIITVGFGTPEKAQTVVFDTGSDISWIQCKPCLVECYKQVEQLFDPAQSSSYRNFSCDSSACRGLPIRGCYNSNTCLYGVPYGDGSSSAGFLASDTLRMTTVGVLDNFMFGCGQRNQGLLKSYAGLIGLGRSAYSLNSQLESKLPNVFSYCLPSTVHATGYLNFGKSLKIPTGYTPIMNDTRAPSLYFVNLIGITVRGKKLVISPEVFTSAGTIIDSGTEVTRLPPAAYNALKTAFRAAMTKYPLTAAYSIMDTCYDLRKFPTVTYPVITLHYAGVDVKLPASGTFYNIRSSQVCLAFAGNPNANQVAIIGNIQQRTMEVTYDNISKRIGFAQGACS